MTARRWEPLPEGAAWQYAIYENPSDHPGSYVIRGWVIVPGEPNPRATNFVELFATLDDARAKVRGGELVCMPATPFDDPKLVEVWL